MTPATISFNHQIAPALAHEVRNPLTNINLSVEMLNAAVKDTELKIYIDIIMRSTKKINDLINELLTTQNQIHTGEYSINKLLEEIIEDTNDRIKLKHIAVTMNLTPEENNLVFDRPKMKIALSNIIINAIEAMPSQNGRLDLVAKSIHTGHMLLIRDNGCGISKVNLKKIFNPYFTSKPGGLGVGLATTYDILQSNHVRINVESQEEKGTSFFLLFDGSKKNYTNA
jgi:signal transduction histidine kinase